MTPTPARLHQSIGTKQRLTHQGPLSEELVFRSSLLAVSILARQTPRWLVFGTPLYFGIAHAHHAWNVYTKARKQGAGMRDALIPAVAGGGALYRPVVFLVVRE